MSTPVAGRFWVAAVIVGITIATLGCKSGSSGFGIASLPKMPTLSWPTFGTKKTDSSVTANGLPAPPSASALPTAVVPPKVEIAASRDYPGTDTPYTPAYASGIPGGGNAPASYAGPMAGPSGSPPAAQRGFYSTEGPYGSYGDDRYGAPQDPAARTASRNDQYSQYSDGYRPPSSPAPSGGYGYPAAGASQYDYPSSGYNSGSYNSGGYEDRFQGYPGGSYPTTPSGSGNYSQPPASYHDRYAPSSGYNSGTGGSGASTLTSPSRYGSDLPEYRPGSVSSYSADRGAADTARGGPVAPVSYHSGWAGAQCGVDGRCSH